MTISYRKSSNLALSSQFSQFQRFSQISIINILFISCKVNRLSNSGSLTCAVCFIIQCLSSHYNLTSFSNNLLLTSLINITSQSRDQQSCQNRQNNQNYDQLYQRKAALLAAALLLQRDHFSIMIFILQFLFFYFCNLRRCSAGLHIFYRRYVGFVVSVISFFKGISYRRSMTRSSE